ncbi:hypothetical protein JN11_01125 [Mucilaginibacter frigoritolerans]|uniref:Uncharacterized protein n=1 Tax=Mucilaginibacter frigoritolerans TaxID=652788 RepID=A0A562UD35_9SPHI|nr:hypothetical protein [Mucilaginibacter frigoritolerans]TWJ03579.1 hypothetical protein JN11_01125 [Mucilaginibacter frigoritolerans]
MKAIVRYISLLLVSGLILHFYNTGIHKLSGDDQFKKNLLTQSPAIHPHYNTSPFAALFFKEIAKELFPVLKN